MTAVPPVGHAAACRTGTDSPAELLGGSNSLSPWTTRTPCLTCVWDANPCRRFLIGSIAHLGFEVAILVRHGTPAVVPWTRGAGCCDVESIGRGRDRCSRRCHGAGRAAGDPDRGRSARRAGAAARTGSGRVPGFDGGNLPPGRARGPGDAAPVGCPRWGWRTPGRLHDDQRRHPGADRCGRGLPPDPTRRRHAVHELRRRARLAPPRRGAAPRSG
jgi:hypothetical protein